MDIGEAEELNNQKQPPRRHTNGLTLSLFALDCICLVKIILMREKTYIPLPPPYYHHCKTFSIPIPAEASHHWDPN